MHEQIGSAPELFGRVPPAGPVPDLRSRLTELLPDEARLLGRLVRLLSARNVLEIGTFTGYSTLCMARALTQGGRVVTCDLDAHWASIARGHWQRAGVADRIDLRLGDTAATVAALLATDGPGSFDLAFIDAEETRRRRYFDLALDLVRSGGLIVLDHSPGSLDDHRVEAAACPVAGGITLALKR